MSQLTQTLRLVFTALAAVTTSGLVATQAADRTTTYRSACDGSAAVALDRDHFVVADDESNVLRIYRMGEPNAILPDLVLNQFLEAPEKKRARTGR